MEFKELGELAELVELTEFTDIPVVAWLVIRLEVSH